MLNCLYCNKVFNPKQLRQKFCSQSCSASYNNTRKVKKFKICNGCENKIYGKKNNKYCSSECFQEFRNKIWVSLWIDGDTAVVTAKGGQLLNKARKYLIKQAGTKCSKCNWCEPNIILGYPILCVDHINGVWYDNKIENLQVLCYNCHTLTPTFGTLNKTDKSRPHGERKTLPENFMAL